MRAFIMSSLNGLWVTFGKDAVEAAKTLPAHIDQSQVSVSGSHDLTKPIDLYKLWPHFTNSPNRTESK